ncbi:cupin domain-containing protein [Pedobacter sp. BS3]|uniref:cupin domain-containing protein n=1 Tax=Pedobacter sp. BS3 TaxID=2567937 RepID=UPI0011EDFC22|nr:cupin domain-containing protein [Pedobacter sp. BS3]TZF83060.1 cupin domain-containing protein [Pedobacter sp. BS3]
MSAQTLIQQLQLQKHPEGGFYRETYRCSDTLTSSNKTRNVSTAIYYLLENADRSHFHRIQSDELWFFHQGATVEIIMLTDGQSTSILLGNNLEQGEVPQVIIPANTWFAARLKHANGYALVSCTVAPGFDFADFELAGKESLLQQYPHSKILIDDLTLP